MTKKFTFLAICLCISLIWGCSQQESEDKKSVNPNPPAEGFNLEASDEKAIEIADQVVEAMGGRENWDATRFFKWTFLGRRTLYWDKLEGRVRIEYPQLNATMLVNVFTDSGKVMIDGEELTNPDSIAYYNKEAKNIWINDSYWLVMPFKLKDSGVTLKYLGSDTTLQKTEADVIQLTFEKVGETPENRYEIFVDKQSYLISQWNFYGKAADTKPRIKTPWTNYQTYGKIKLSSDRGNFKLTDIQVFDNLDDAVFEDFAPVELN